MVASKALSLALLLLAVSTGLAQSREPDDSWLMQNYRFSGPPEETQPVAPAVAQLQEIQNTVLSILRKADFAGDLPSALAAAAQAAANAQMIGVLTGQLTPVPPPGAPMPREPQQPAPARYLVAFQDHTVQLASAVWMDATMLHYLTPSGAHGQVRLDRVDWKLSADLNRCLNR